MLAERRAGDAEAGSAARHAGVALVGNVLNQVCFLVATVVIARGLGPTQYAVYASAMALSIILSTLAAGGLDVILVREAVRTREQAATYLGTAIALKLALTLVVLLGLALYDGAIGVAPMARRALWVAMLANLVRIHERTWVAAFRALGRMALEGVVLGIQGGLFVLLVVGLGARITDARGALEALLGSYLVSLTVGMALIVRQGLRPRFGGGLPVARFMAREALPVGVAAVLAYLYERLPILALGLLSAPGDVALFSSAFSIVRNLGVVPLVVAGAALPVLSRLAVGPGEHLQRAYGSVWRLLFALGVPLAVGCWFLAEPLMAVVFGPEYAGGYRVLRVLATSVVFSFLAYLAKAGLEATSAQARWTVVLAVGVVLGAGLQMALIPRLGHVGAGVALVVADVVVLGLATRGLGRHIARPLAGLGRFVACCLLGGGAMVALLVALQTVALLPRVLLGAALYLGALVALRAWDADEIAPLIAALRRPGGREGLGHEAQKEVV
ncbi:MAG TPA: flippase [Chloroflexi bacterium]|jgi:O-antigen/teichoic acid export membrane protein|nr:flippase [Chloroflexota bacterium]